MKEREWAKFLESHYRPHLISVELGVPAASRHGQKLIAALRRLAASLQSVGEFAVLAKESAADVAIERDTDAETLRNLLRARTVERHRTEWVSEADCDLGARLPIARSPARRG